MATKRDFAVKRTLKGFTAVPMTKFEKRVEKVAKKVAAFLGLRLRRSSAKFWNGNPECRLPAGWYFTFTNKGKVPPMDTVVALLKYETRTDLETTYYSHSNEVYVKGGVRR